MLKGLFGRKKNRETPIDRFQREIQGWPDDAAENALRLFKATLEGDQVGIDRYYQELTMNQLDFVKRTLEEIEAELE